MSNSNSKKVPNRSSACAIKNLLTIVLFSLSSLSTLAQTAGVVVKADGDCTAGSDRMIIETSSGYVLAEHYRGRFYEGRRVYGNLHSYGFKDVKVNGNDARIYIEDYWASKDKAIEWCFGSDD